ncbi:MAG: BON domain-containing protein [Anaerolineae bacterium]
MDDIRVGGEVRAIDGLVGTVEHIVRDSRSGEVSDIVVDRGGLGLIVLPLSAVSSVRDGTVELGVPLEKVASARVYDEQDFKSCELEPHASASDKPLSWRCRYGAGVSAAPAVAGMVPNVPSVDQPPAVGRGTPVYWDEGPLAMVDHILYDGETGEVTHLVLAAGPQLARSTIMPITMVDGITESGIHVKAGREELSNFGFYSARPDQEIREEVRQCLAEAGCEPESVDVSVDHGVVTMAGTVPDAATMRRADAAVRRVEGVVDVENALTLDSAVAAGIMAALAQDQRTLESALDVSVMHGVVSLTGTVATEDERMAAEEIAGRAAGASPVINELVVNKNITRIRDREGVFVLHPSEWRGRGNWANWPGY